jgi:anti-repressor protein
MAKEICMLQRTDNGRKCRQHFIQIEEACNTTERVLERAQNILRKRVPALENVSRELAETVVSQQQKIEKLSEKADYFDVILSCKNAVPISVIAKDYGKSVVRLNNFLSEYKIQYLQGNIWLFYQQYAACGYTCSKTYLKAGKGDKMNAFMTTRRTQRGRLFIY